MSVINSMLVSWNMFTYTSRICFENQFFFADEAMDGLVFGVAVQLIHIGSQLIENNPGEQAYNKL